MILPTLSDVAKCRADCSLSLHVARKHALRTSSLPFVYIHMTDAVTLDRQTDRRDLVRVCGQPIAQAVLARRQLLQVQTLTATALMIAGPKLILVADLLIANPKAALHVVVDVCGPVIGVPVLCAYVRVVSANGRERNQHRINGRE